MNEHLLRHLNLSDEQAVLDLDNLRLSNSAAHKIRVAYEKYIYQAARNILIQQNRDIDDLLNLIDAEASGYSITPLWYFIWLIVSEKLGLEGAPRYLIPTEMLYLVSAHEKPAETHDGTTIYLEVKITMDEIAKYIPFDEMNKYDLKKRALASFITDYPELKNSLTDLHNLGIVTVWGCLEVVSRDSLGRNKKATLEFAIGKLCDQIGLSEEFALAKAMEDLAKTSPELTFEQEMKRNTNVDRLWLRQLLLALDKDDRSEFNAAVNAFTRVLPRHHYPPTISGLFEYIENGGKVLELGEIGKGKAEKVYMLIYKFSNIYNISSQAIETILEHLWEELELGDEEA